MRKSIMLLGLVLAAGIAVASVSGENNTPVLDALFDLPARTGSQVLFEGPTWNDNPAETLHYDGDNNNGIGLTGGGTYRGAVRFTPTATCTVKSVLFYQRDPSDNEYVFIFAEGTDTTPGPILDSVPYTGSGGMQWKNIDLSTPLIVLAGTDFWACVRVTHDSGAFPLGTDAGPMVRDRGGFIATGNTWQQLEDLALDYNWNVRAIVEPVPGQTHDVGVTRIFEPGTNVAPGTYTPTCRVVNFGDVNESDIPVTCQIDSAGTLVYDESTTVPGPLQPGGRAEVMFSPDWTTGPAGAAYSVCFFTEHAGDPDRSNDTLGQMTNIATGQALMDHDTGYCKLTVSCFGPIGFDQADAGSGFCYPKTAASALFYGSFAVGNAADWVADRHFGNPASGPQDSDLNPVDSLRAVLPPGNGDQHFRGKFDDSGHPAPKDLLVTQNSYMDAATGYDDFVVIVYDVMNNSGSAINGLYAGLFADFDIGADPASNLAGSDTARRVVWMRQQSSANPTVGVKILDPPMFSNLCCIDHARYVYPDSCMIDGQKYRVMDGTITQYTSNRPYDWSVCASIGSFDLPSGASQRFAVALVGGTSEAEALAHADSAQAWWSGTGYAQGPGRPEAEARVKVYPNPFRAGASISYHARTAGLLRLDVFDAAGRSVEQRSIDVKQGNGVYRWQPAGLARGVYFLEVEAPGEAAVTKVLKLE